MSKQRTVIGVLLGLVLIFGLWLIGSVSWKAYRSNRREEFVSQSEALAQQQDWDGLEIVAKSWMEAFPEDGDALLFAADAYGRQGNIEQAAVSLRRIRNDDPRALKALLICSDLYFNELNLPFEAEELWQRMLKINPLADVARQRLIYFYAMTLQRQKMTDEIKSAMALACEPPEAYSYFLLRNSLNFSNGLQLSTRWLRNDPENEILLVCQAIYAAKKTRDRLRATFGIQTIVPGDRSILEERLKQFPQNLELLALQIDILIYEGEKSEVVKLLSQAPDSATEDSRFWRHRGWLFMQQMKFPEATNAFEQALTLNPYDWQARMQLADTLRNQGRVKDSDHHAELASQGKKLQERLFELPRASDVDAEILVDIRAYADSLDDQSVVAAIDRRI